MSSTLSRGAPGTVAGAGLSKGPFRAPRGTEISCKGWQQEAALRMLLNNLDPEVAEKPEDLVVYGGTGKAARNWECFHAIVRSLKALGADETLLVQSGKPVGVFRTHEYAPRVLLCNSNLVGYWNNWDRFHELDRAGLMMYGQMTAGSWIYIGTQGILQNAVRKGEATSVGLVGNCADLIPELAKRGVVPDLLTDQTSAHDPIGGYVPNGMTLEAALELRKKSPEEYKKRAMAAMAAHVQGMLDLQKLGAVTFDYGNNIRTFAFQQGVKNAYDFPGFVPAYIRPLFCEGKGPFRWAALSGEASDIARTDQLVLEMFPNDEHLNRWIKLAQKRVRFQGLPSRICWLGYGERDRFGLALNELVAKGEIKASVVRGRA